jgi:hypothetical protein
LRTVKELIEQLDYMTIPKEQKALVIQEGQTLKVETIPVPKVSGDDILVKVGEPRRNRDC